MFLLFEPYSILKSEDAIDHAVRLNSTFIKGNINVIKLSWQGNIDTNVRGYLVLKKLKDIQSWTLLDSLPYGKLNYVYLDSNVKVGVGYEYQIIRVTKTYTGYGYIYTGIELPLTEFRGYLVFMVDNSVSDSLKSELDMFENDLRTDGWVVIRHEVPRADTFNPWMVEKVKNQILIDHEKSNYNVKAVILFGRIAVPYSGDYAYDGHPDHKGAWPSDVFYAVPDGEWTDLYVKLSTNTRNSNIPFDGKYDNNTIPSDAVFQVGRIDMFKLPELLKSEIQLLREYIIKNHTYRNSIIKPNYRGFIYDGFGIYGEAPASSAWSNFSAILGTVNVDSSTVSHCYENVLNTQSYLWSYACNSGAYDNVMWGVYTADLPQLKINSIFTSIFGSYNGDWDSENNILRAIIGSAPSMLTCFWGCRPFWHYHHMGMGENIGYSTLVTQNNYSLYPNFETVGYRGNHVALLGDPTLRMYMMEPPKNIVITNHFSNANKRSVSLSWTSSPDAQLGYNIYRADSLSMRFIKLNNKLLTDTIFVDNNANIHNYYIVKAYKLQQTATGSFYNESQGILTAYDFETGINDISDNHFVLALQPNPASTDINISFSTGTLDFITLKVFDLNGNLRKTLFEGYVNTINYNITWDLLGNDGNRIPAGIYLFQYRSGTSVITKKIIILP